jgi:hypothetical protein
MLIWLKFLHMGFMFFASHDEEAAIIDKPKVGAVVMLPSHRAIKRCSSGAEATRHQGIPPRPWRL